MAHHLLKATEHRPYPLPESPWIMHQAWRDLLFAHWPLEPDYLQKFMPPGLKLDLYDGKAWLAVVPFRMSNVRPRWVPPMPWISAFPELNVRTYVELDGRPGVFFFGLEATNPLAVWLARKWFHLPYFNADISLEYSPPGEFGADIKYVSNRTHRNAAPARFIGEYGPTGPVYESKPGTLEHWLTERYCLYSVDGRGAIRRGEVQHIPWPLQPAQAKIETNTMTSCHGIELPDTEPILHFVKRIDVIVWHPIRVGAPPPP